MKAERIKLLKEYIKGNPNDPFNKYALALEYLSINELDEALKLFNQLLDQHSDYLPSYYQAAQLYWSINEMEQANITFQNGINLAEAHQDYKALSELKAAYMNFQIEWDE